MDTMINCNKLQDNLKYNTHYFRVSTAANDIS